MLILKFSLRRFYVGEYFKNAFIIQKYKVLSRYIIFSLSEKKQLSSRVLDSYLCSLLRKLRHICIELKAIISSLKQEEEIALQNLLLFNSYDLRKKIPLKLLESISDTFKS